MVKRGAVKSTVGKLLKILGALLLLLVLLVLAWLASNNRFVDNKPQPVPEALRLKPVSLAPERNTFFAFQAMTVPMGMDPMVEGRKYWTTGEYSSAHASLKWPATKLWNCSSDLPACVANWRGDPQGLAALLSESAGLGERCAALSEPGLGFEEVLAEPKPELKKTTDQYAAHALPQFSSVTHCMRWLHAKAVLAQTQGDVQASERALQQAGTLLQNFLSGSRSLISHMVAWSVAQRHFQLLTLMAAADPAHAVRYAEHLHELPAIVREAAPWVPAEANFGRELMRELALGCELADSSLPPGTAGELRCSRSLLVMPEATTQLYDGVWMQLRERGREGGPLGLIGWSPQLEEGLFFGHPWRNSMGHILIAVATGGAYGSYFEGQADGLLTHAAARLAFRAAADKPADPAAWLAAQGLDKRLLARIRIDKGAVIAKRWRVQSDKPAELAFPIPVPAKTPQQDA